MRHLLAFLCLPLAACAIAPSRDEPVVPPEAAAVPVPARDGSIYSAGGGHALSEDQKARSLGELLTVMLVEQTPAVKKANTSTTQNTCDATVTPTLHGRPP